MVIAVSVPVRIVNGEKVTDGPPMRNLKLFRLDTSPASLMNEYVAKKSSNWQPQFSDDETLASQLVGPEILFKDTFQFGRLV